jgi:hypothetical protein
VPPIILYDLRNQLYAPVLSVKMYQYQIERNHNTVPKVPRTLAAYHEVSESNGEERRTGVMLLSTADILAYRTGKEIEVEIQTKESYPAKGPPVVLKLI